MKLEGLTADDDFLLHQAPDSFETVVSPDPRWFERLYFNLHDQAGDVLIVAGFGVFPNTRVADGYVVASDATAQRSIRLARDLGGRRTATEVGPLHLAMLEPMRRWNLRLEETEGIAFDVTFEARTVAHSVGMIEFKQSDGPNTAFNHYNQAGAYSGELAIDGEARVVSGWIGQRDHSWGLRRPRERLGLHFWICAHVGDRTFMVSYNESREHEVSFCEGAVLFADDRDPVRVIDFRHDLTLAPDGLQAQHARLRFLLEGGEDVELAATPTIPGLWMAGAGYGGWHGQHRGDLHVESDRREHGSDRQLVNEPIGLVDQLSRFECGDESGVGVLEMAVSRSSTYTYAPRW